jgi:muramoyltetrapeptide carboxypeptidase LdcA involved in peptidoglycan recycling
MEKKYRVCIKDGTIIEVSNINLFRKFDDIVWFEETATMTAKEVEKMYGKLKNYKIFKRSNPQKQ